VKTIPMNNHSQNEKTYTFSEIANEIGLSEDELIELALFEGLIDENGFPTKKAIDLGILTVEISTQ